MIPNPIKEFINDLSELDNDSKAFYLIDLADSFIQANYPKPYPEEHRVPACESEVFIWLKNIDNKYYLDLIVENPQGISAKAMGVILQSGINGIAKEEVLLIPDDLAYEIFGKSLSMGKGLGLVSMVQLIKTLAKNI